MTKTPTWYHPLTTYRLLPDGRMVHFVTFDEGYPPPVREGFKRMYAGRYYALDEELSRLEPASGVLLAC